MWIDPCWVELFDPDTVLLGLKNITESILRATTWVTATSRYTVHVEFFECDVKWAEACRLNEYWEFLSSNASHV
jgi:hypothetical protein